MSSQGSPRLELDLRGRYWERRVAWFALILPPVCLMLLLPLPAAIGFGALTALAVMLGLLRAGWLGGADRIQRVTWSSDGRWQLTDARGRVLEGTLRADTRVASRLVWLRWNTSWTRSMLLVSGDIDMTELRRLIVRLRIEGVRQAPSLRRSPGAPRSKISFS